MLVIKGCFHSLINIYFTEYKNIYGLNRGTLDNILIKRFWKSVKYNYFYLNPAADGF
jgi:hypothetical protein